MRGVGCLFSVEVLVGVEVLFRLQCAPLFAPSWLVLDCITVFRTTPRKIDVRPPGKGNSNSHGAKPVYQIISMIKWTP